MVVVACCCCILYQLALHDAGPDLCTLCPDLCTLHPDLWTLCLWCFPSFKWCKHSTCTGGGCHQLQLALVVLFHSATSADSPLAHMVVSPSATCAGGAFSSIHWCNIMHLHPGNLHCVVVVSGGGYSASCNLHHKSMQCKLQFTPLI